MLNLVIERLNYLNYKVTQSDLYIIKFLILKEENIIRIDCNITDIPEELSYILVDRIVGAFLREKKIVDPESLIGIDLDTQIKQIQEGDTNITFSDKSKTSEERFDEMITYLVNREVDLACYRRLRW